MLLLNVVDVSHQQISETKSCTYHTGTTEQSHVCPWNTALRFAFLAAKHCVYTLRLPNFLHPQKHVNN